MAQNQNSKKSEGVCEKIFNAISGGRKNPRISHEVQASVSSETAPKTQVQASDNPAKASLLNQPSFRKIPIEPSIRPSPVLAEKGNIQPASKKAGKEDGSEISVREKVLINGEWHGLKGRVQIEKVASMEKTMATKDKEIQEKGDEDENTSPESLNRTCSAYIERVRDKIKMATVSNVDSGGDGKTATRIDSFNDI